MGNLPVTLATRDYEYLTPLALGDVTPEGIDLTVIRDPAHHLVVLRRELVEEHPWIGRSVYAALCRAREHADRTRRLLHESSAWLLADLEEEAELLGPDFQPYGARANRAMIAAFCEEQWVQGLVPRRLDPDEVFAEFERLAG